MQYSKTTKECFCRPDPKALERDAKGAGPSTKIPATHQVLLQFPKTTTLNGSTLQVRQIIPSLRSVLILRNMKPKRTILIFRERMKGNFHA